MRKTPEQVEAEIPLPGTPNSPKLPKVRRQLERICDSTGVVYDELLEMRIQPGVIHVHEYMKNSEGAHYLNENGHVASTWRTIQVDTDTFLGDERDV